MRSVRIVVLLLITSLAAVAAQENTPPAETYEWTAAGIRLEYPAHWDTALSLDQNGQHSLQLAQAFIETPLEARPPGIPLIQLNLLRDGAIANNDLVPLAITELQNIGIDNLSEPTDSTFFDGPASELIGTSADGQLLGLARVGVMGVNDVVIMTGRAAAAQRDDFLNVFDQVANSVTATNTAAAVEYGILWHTMRTLQDNDEGLLDLVGLAYGPANRLYTFERDLGVVEIDAATGDILNVTANENITAPTDIAVTSTGTVYISDTDCGCIYTLTKDGLWLDQATDAALTEEGATSEIAEDSTEAGEAVVDDEETGVAQNTGLIEGFSPGAPAHITVGPDDILYATDLTSTDTVVVMSYQGTTLDSTIRVNDSLFEQPLLAASPDGAVIALTQFGELFALPPPTANSIGSIGPATGPITSFTITPEDGIGITIARQGVTLLTIDGQFVTQAGSVVAGFPLPGEFVSPSGIVTGPDGTLYIADSDGSFGAITAMSTGVALDRLGSTTLTPGLAVQGILNEDTPQQTWLYTAAAGDQISITALDNSGAGELDVALRLLDPDGNEVAANDDHDSPDIVNFSDAHIAGQTLEADGDYILRVERMAGEGSYTLGLTLTHAIVFNTEGVGTVFGQLGFAFPAERWTFDGRAGQTLTMTLEPTSGDLDPILRIFGPDSMLIDENDDAPDLALGPTSQLVNVSLPADGNYTLEAARFEGAGRYALTVVTTS